MIPVALREPPGVLARIVARKLSDLADELANERSAAPPAATTAPPPVRDLLAGLRARASLALIAEVKPRAPSMRPIARAEVGAATDPQGSGVGLDARVAAYSRHASAISVLCDQPFFGGSLALLAEVRKRTSLPVICKDFIVTPSQIESARAHGADAVLLIAALLPPASLARLLGVAHDLGMRALVETHTTDEVREAVDVGAQIIGVNARDLRTLQVDLCAARDLLASIPDGCVRVAESGVATRKDVDSLRGVADAVLIGTALMRAPDPAARMAAWGWPPC